MTGFVGAISGATAVTSVGGVVITHYDWPFIFYLSGGMTIVWAILWPGYMITHLRFFVFGDEDGQ